MMSAPHRWRFARAGGFVQVRLDTADDLRALDQLDQKLWVALACPARGLELDEKTLELVDTDHDGRIRAPEILAAVRWACERLRDPATLTLRRDALPLDAIDDRDAEGKHLLGCARRILAGLGKADAKQITVEDTQGTAKLVAQMELNGDGVVPAASATDPEIARAIADVVGAGGGVPDRSGQPGVSAATLEAFFAEAAAFDAWWSVSERDAATVLPLGERTAAAALAVGAVQAKVDDWFARGRLAAFDERAAGPLNRDAAEYAALAARELSAAGDELASFPLARVVAGGALPLDRGLNPAWRDAMAKLRTDAVEPLLGPRDQLDERDWAELRAKLAPYEAWRAARAGATVEPLGIARVRELLRPGVRAAIEALIAEDASIAPEVDAVASVEKLVRFHRDLHQLLDNFVAFRDFYSRQRKAIFQAGTLFLDGRSFDLCLRVRDAAAHASLATLGKTYLAYCACTREASGEQMTIVAAMTGGDADALMVGRNGVFYDRKGNDWDATIVKIVEHPISIRQAFWTPYRTIGRLVGDQIEKLASARDQDMRAKAASRVGEAGKAVDGSPGSGPTPAQAFDVAKFAGIFAAIGLAVGAIGSALAAIVTGFLGLTWWQMPLALLGIVAVVSGPSMVIAALELRQRSLGPILDANGWAVNARARVNIPFGGSLTALPRLPAGAGHALEDPFAESGARWPAVAVAAVVLAVLAWAAATGRARAWLAASASPPGSASAVAAPPAAASAASK